MMYEKIAKAIHSRVWELFDYEYDIKNYRMNEHWTSHAATVNLGKRFTDDCDGFALTCAELLIEADVPRSRISIVYCHTELQETHLVCGVGTGKTTLILDNRFSRIYNWQNSNYKWNYYMTFEDIGQWHATSF